MKIQENNQVTLIGTFGEDITFSHEVHGEKFYQNFLTVARKSNNIDTIPVTVSERLINLEDYAGQKVEVRGQYRSFNKVLAEGKRHLMLFVFAQEVEKVDTTVPDDNKVILDGYTCKETTYRRTPLGREITDLHLAVNRKYGKSDYIPCVAWGRNAQYADNFPVGTHIKVEGRIQSREYEKLGETRTVYEVSIGKLEVVED